MKHILSEEDVTKFKGTIHNITLASTTGDKHNPSKKLEMAIQTKLEPYFKIFINNELKIISIDIEVACDIYNSY